MRIINKRFIAELILVFLYTLAVVGIARAQGGIEILEHAVSYQFNEWIRLEARFASSETLVDGRVFLQIGENHGAQVFTASPDSQDRIVVEIELVEGIALTPFTDIDYWFVVSSEGGTIYESPRYSFTYEDNRFVWQSLPRGAFTIWWHSGSPAFGEAILSAAENGVTRTQSLLPLPPPEQLEFRVYDSADEIRALLQLAGYGWVAGHTDPKLGIVLLSIAPGGQSSLEIERQVPHEVAHAMLYQATGQEHYTKLPAWLIEGIASNAELYSDPQAQAMLETAYSEGNLLSLASLCTSFPQEAQAARLAYAEARSFVAYLRQAFGVVGLGALVDAYSGEDGCVQTPATVLGRDLAVLEADWAATTFDPPGNVERWLDAIPWTGIGVSALVAAALAILLRWRSRAR